MPKTPAQRQAEYRQRHLKAIEGTGERLDTVVSVQAMAGLRRLSKHHGLTQRAMLERLLVDADQATASSLEKPSAYLDGVTE